MENNEEDKLECEGRDTIECKYCNEILDITPYMDELKAKMDLQDALIKEQKKQIIGFAKDNALLHKRLKKCQEEKGGGR